MTNGDRMALSSGQLSTDLLIVGGGIMGLWAARFATEAGLNVVLVDAKGIASGASGGLLGSLMPYMPDRWCEKKQFQFDALLSLEEEVARLEVDTGLTVGYRRAGRLIMLPKPHLRTIALRHERDAQTAWCTHDRSFAWQVLDQSPFGPDWPDPQYTQGGLVFDTLAARVSPRGLTAAIRASLATSPLCHITAGVPVTDFDIKQKKAVFSDGSTIAFGSAMIAAGTGSFPLLERLSPPLPQPLGVAVKGQSALLQADIDPTLPLLFLDGVYIVPHDDGRVAIGSTSENLFEQPFSTDGQLEELIDRVRVLVPALRDAPVIERWAGLRPKAIDRDPMVGPHPDHPFVIALTGGFKISFGLAHRLAQAALAPLIGQSVSLPPGFTLAHHLEVASRKK
ncbi:FAD-binding oxidoreductase [Rhizobium sp.]|jgi:glycine oxidase|uniref:NAD(P)/FAD-dependent oxidoreductase n=1 Tax=Rhizobium sp. TaxID=391 RepID=UPI000E84FBF2|nr:D-amino-acid oxidase [Rhizobium sp.]